MVHINLPTIALTFMLLIVAASAQATVASSPITAILNGTTPDITEALFKDRVAALFSGAAVNINVTRFVQAGVAANGNTTVDFTILYNTLRNAATLASVVVKNLPTHPSFTGRWSLLAKLEYQGSLPVSTSGPVYCPTVKPTTAPWLPVKSFVSFPMTLLFTTTNNTFKFNLNNFAWRAAGVARVKRERVRVDSYSNSGRNYTVVFRFLSNSTVSANDVALVFWNRFPTSTLFNIYPLNSISKASAESVPIVFTIDTKVKVYNQAVFQARVASFVGVPNQDVRIENVTVTPGAFNTYTSITLRIIANTTEYANTLMFHFRDYYNCDPIFATTFTTLFVRDYVYPNVGELSYRVRVALRMPTLSSFNLDTFKGLVANTLGLPRVNRNVGIDVTSSSVALTKNHTYVNVTFRFVWSTFNVQTAAGSAVTAQYLATKFVREAKFRNGNFTKNYRIMAVEQFTFTTVPNATLPPAVTAAPPTPPGTKSYVIQVVAQPKAGSIPAIMKDYNLTFARKVSELLGVAQSTVVVASTFNSPKFTTLFSVYSNVAANSADSLANAFIAQAETSAQFADFDVTSVSAYSPIFNSTIATAFVYSAEAATTAFFTAFTTAVANTVQIPAANVIVASYTTEGSAGNWRTIVQFLTIGNTNDNANAQTLQAIRNVILVPEIATGYQLRAVRYVNQEFFASIYYSVTVVGTVSNVAVAAFNNSDFATKAALVVSQPASQIAIISTTAEGTTTRVTFRFRAASITAANATMTQFLNNYATTAAFTGNYTLQGLLVTVPIEFSSPLGLILNSTSINTTEVRVRVVGTIGNFFPLEDIQFGRTDLSDARFEGKSVTSIRLLGNTRAVAEQSLSTLHSANTQFTNGPYGILFQSIHTIAFPEPTAFSTNVYVTLNGTSANITTAQFIANVATVANCFVFNVVHNNTVDSNGRAVVTFRFVSFNQTAAQELFQLFQRNATASTQFTGAYSIISLLEPGTNATTTVAPGVTTPTPNATTLPPGVTAAPGNATTTTPSPNATNATTDTATPVPTTPQPGSTPLPTPSGTPIPGGEASSPPITVSIDLPLADFKPDDFKNRTAALLGVDPKLVAIDSVNVGSLIVVFRLLSSNVQAAAQLADNFKNTYASSPAFTSAYKVLSISVAATPVPTPVPGIGTVLSRPVTIALDGTLSSFSEATFRQKAASVVGTSASNIQIDSALAGSVVVVFRIRANSVAEANNLAVAFTNLASSSAEFTGTYRVLAVSYNAATALKAFSAALFAVLFFAALF